VAEKLLWAPLPDISGGENHRLAFLIGRYDKQITDPILSFHFLEV
jgi:hypothetical protein